MSGQDAPPSGSLGPPERLSAESIAAIAGADDAYWRGLIATPYTLAHVARSLALTAAAPGGLDETETCPTCWQPVPVPQRGDHDYGIPLAAPGGLDVELRRLRDTSTDPNTRSAANYLLMVLSLSEQPPVPEELP